MAMETFKNYNINWIIKKVLFIILVAVKKKMKLNISIRSRCEHTGYMYVKYCMFGAIFTSVYNVLVLENNWMNEWMNEIFITKFNLNFTIIKENKIQTKIQI